MLVVRDPSFGPLIMFGLGGVAAELVGDTALKVAPLTDQDAAELVWSLRSSPLLFGYRGSVPVDTAALSYVLASGVTGKFLGFEMEIARKAITEKQWNFQFPMDGRCNAEKP